jgi:hypothetical protein
MSVYEPAISGRPQRDKLEQYAFRADVQTMFQVCIRDKYATVLFWRQHNKRAQHMVAGIAVQHLQRAPLC